MEREVSDRGEREQKNERYKTEKCNRICGEQGGTLAMY
jgi:hypothetical protein